MRRHLLLVLSLSLTVAAGIVTVQGDEARSQITPPAPGTADPEAVSPQKHLACTSPSEPLNFAAYWAGPEFDGLPVTAVARRCDEPRSDEPGRANYVGYLYGDCDAGPDEGCAVPIEIQTWPAVERAAGTGSSGGGLEISMGKSTIVIFGGDAQARRFADALRQGPALLTDLDRDGLSWDADCVREPTCHASKGGLRLPAVVWIVIVALVAGLVLAAVRRVRLLRSGAGRERP